MNTLLHSKRFQKNLLKWIAMYIGVMVLFATVVTYSKYITQMGSNSESRVASFEVGIAFDSCPTGNMTENKNDDGTITKICDTGIYRPTSKIPYTFEVDTSKLEVNTMLVLNINTDATSNLFEILDFEEINGDKFVTDGQIVSTNPSKTMNVTRDATGKITGITFSQDIKAASKQKLKYRVSIKLKESELEYNHENLERVITVGYSALQLTN